MLPALPLLLVHPREQLLAPRTQQSHCRSSIALSSLGWCVWLCCTWQGALYGTARPLAHPAQRCSRSRLWLHGGGSRLVLACPPAHMCAFGDRMMLWSIPPQPKPWGRVCRFNRISQSGFLTKQSVPDSMFVRGDSVQAR